MKTRKKILLSALSIFATFFAVLFGLYNIPTVEAGTTAPYLTVEYKTYLVDDYEKLAKLDTWADDLIAYIELGADDVSTGQITTSDSYIGDADDAWRGNGPDAMSRGGTTPYLYYGGGTPFELLSAAIGSPVTTITFTTYKSGRNWYVDAIDSAFMLGNYINETDEFSPNDIAVIVQYVQGSTYYKDVSTALDLEFISSTQPLVFSKAKTKNTTSASSISANEFYVWANSKYGNKYNTQVNSTGTYYTTDGTTVTSASSKSVFKGGGGSSDTTTWTTKDMSFAVAVKVDASANGDYVIQPSMTADSKYLLTTAQSYTYTGTAATSPSTHWNVVSKTIRVNGASNETKFATLNIDSSNITLPATQSPYETYTKVAAGTAIAGNTFYKVDGNTMAVATFASTVTQIPATGDYYTLTTSTGAVIPATVAAANTSTDVVGTVDKRGTVIGARYSVSTSTTTATAALALSSGTSAPSNTSGTGYTVPMYNAGTTMYVAIINQSQDKSKVATYVIEITRKEYNLASMQSIGLSAVGDPSGITTANLLNAAGTASATFNGTSNQTYTVKVPSDATGILVTPSWVVASNDASKYMVCKVEYGTSSVTIDTTTPDVTVPTTLTQFKVTITSQDGSVTKTFTYKIATLSSDNKIKETTSYVEVGSTKIYLNDSSVTKNADGDEYTIPASKIKYANTKFNLKIDANNSSAKIVIDSGTAATSTQSKNNIAFNNTPTSANYAEDSVSVPVDVQSESGATKHYTIIVKKDKASSDATLTALVAYDSTNATVALDNPFSNSTQAYVSASDVAFNMTGFYVKATVNDNTAKVTYTKQAGSGTLSGSPSSSGKVYTSPTLGFFGGNTAADSSEIILVTVTAEDTSTKTFTVNVTKAAADNTETFTFTATDNLGNTVSGSLNTTTKKWTTSTNISKTADSVTYEITPQKSTTKAYLNSVSSSNLITGPKTQNLVISPTASNAKTVVTIIIVTEANTSGVTYTFEFVCDVRDIDYSIQSKTIKGHDDGTEYTMETTGSNSTNFIYSVPKSTAGNNFDIVIKTTNPNAKVFIGTQTSDVAGTPYAGNNYGVTSPSTYSGTLLTYNPATQEWTGTFAIGQNYYVKVYSEYALTHSSSSPKVEELYVFNIKAVDERDTDNTITNVSVSGNAEILGKSWAFSSGTASQNPISLSYTTATIDITVVTNNNKSKVYISTAPINTSVSTPLTTGGGTLSNCQSGGTIPISLTAGADTYVYIQCQSEKETFNVIQYEIKITRAAASSANSLTLLKVAGIDYTADIASTMIIPVSISSPVVQFDISPLATCSASYTIGTTTSPAVTASPLNINGIGYGSANGGYAIVEIKVLSEKDQGNIAAAATYSIYLVYADRDATINDIYIKENDATGSDLEDENGNTYTYSASTTTIPFTIKFSAENPYVEVDTNSANAHVTGDGLVSVQKAITTKSASTTVVVMSDFYKVIDGITALSGLKSNYSSEKQQYKFNFKRLAASQDRSVTAKITFAGGNKDGQTVTVTNSLTVEDLGNVTSIKIEVTPTNAGAPITYSFPPEVLNCKAGTDSIANISLSQTPGASSLYTLSVYSESDVAGLSGVTANPTNYQITLCYGTATLDKDASMRNIIVKADNGVTYLTTLTAGKYVYPIQVPGTVKSVDITIMPAQNTSTAKISIDGGAEQAASINTALNYPITAPTTANATTTFEIQLTAQDTSFIGSKYTISIEALMLDETNTISDLKINGTAVPGFDPAKTTGYDVYVGYSVENATASYTPGSAKVVEVSNNANANNPLALNVGTNTVTIVVKSEAGVSNTYSVNVIRDGNTDLTSLEVVKSSDTTTNLITFASGTTIYNVTPNLAYSEGEVVVTAVQADTHGVVTMTMSYGTTLIANGSPFTLPADTVTTIKVTLTPASGAANAKIYTVNIKREKGSDDCTIKSFTTEEGKSLTISNNIIQYSYTLPRNYGLNGSFSPIIEVNHPKAKYDMPSVTAYTYGKNIMDVVVTAEDGTTKPYKFIVYCVDSDPSIANIQLKNGKDGLQIMNNDGSAPQVSFEAGTTSYNVRIPYTVESLSFDISLGSEYSKIYINNKEYTNNSTFTPDQGTKTYRIYALSEYGQAGGTGTGVKSAEYTITIIRNQASTDATLKELKVLVGTKDYLADLSYSNALFAPGTKDYVIQKIGDTISGVTIKATPTDENATVTGAGSKVLTSYSDSGDAGYMFAYDIIVTAEDGHTTIPYTVTITRGQLDLSNDNTVTSITVRDSGGVVYLDASSFDQATTSYPIYEIPYGTQSVTIEVGKLAASPATITIGGAPAANGSRQISVTSNLTGTTQDYQVYATSQNGVDGTKYTITLKFLKAEENTALAVFTVDGIRVKGFNPSTDKEQTIYYYTLDQVSNSKENVLVYAKGAKPEAQTITINNQLVNPYSVTLTAGYNQIVVVCRAESGAQATYVVTITKAYSDPKVEDIQVEGYDLLDLSDKVTTFNTNITEYHVIVPYMASSVVNIKVVVENSYYVVSTTSTYNPVHNGTVWNFSTYSLSEGANYFTITVTSTEGASKSFTLVINKRGNDSVNTNLSLIRIAEIPQFETDYVNSKTSYGVYNVGNDVNDLTFTVVTEVNRSSTGDGATYKIFNDKNLKVGNNKVVVVIISEDESTSRTIIIDVNRDEMLYTVDTDKITDKGFTTTPTSTKNLYKVDLGPTKISTIDESVFTNAITSATNPNLQVEVLSDLKDNTLNEVLVKVSDGYTNEFVRFVLQKDNVDATVDPTKGTYPTTENTSPTSGGIFASEYTINLGEELPTKLTLADFKAYFNSTVSVSLFNPTTITASTTEVDVAVTDGLNTSYVKFNLIHDAIEFEVDLLATDYETTEDPLQENHYFIDLGDAKPTVLRRMGDYFVIEQRYTKTAVVTKIEATTTQIVVRVYNAYNEEVLVTFDLTHSDIHTLYEIDTTATSYDTVADPDDANGLTYIIDLGSDSPKAKLSMAAMKGYILPNSTAVKTEVLTPITALTKEIQVKVSDNYNSEIVTFKLHRDDVNTTPDVTKGDYETKDLSGEYVIDLGDDLPTVLKESSFAKYFDSSYEVKLFNPTKIETNTNQVVVSVSDGISTGYASFSLVHNPLTYDVNFDGITFDVSENSKHDAKYDRSFTIDLGKNSASTIKDYAKLIESNGDVEVLSDTTRDDCHEVVVAIQKGEEVEYVQFVLDTTAGTSTNLSWLIWVLLGVAILLLGVILIVVNKDKYGKIAKSRRR